MHDWGSMKKFKILIPVYNDWESLNRLLIEINKNISSIKNIQFDCVIINDASTVDSPKIDIPSNINSLEIINMKENRGHARCNAFGIRYLASKSDFDHLILMDGDGEDRPEEINDLIKKALDNLDYSVVAKRVKRSEGPFFQFLYQFHKFLTLVSTGKLINFGNYSCLTKNDVVLLSTKASLWSSFSGTVKKYVKNFNNINSIRGMRYFGPSQMSLFKLAIHSFSIIGVFKYQLFFRTLIVLLASYYLAVSYQINFIILQILLVLFNLIVFIVSLREDQKALEASADNVLSKNIHTH